MFFSYYLSSSHGHVLISEFPAYANVTLESDKPPDISNIGMDPGTISFLQFAATVPPPVPDTTAAATASFLDIGLESFQVRENLHLFYCHQRIRTRYPCILIKLYLKAKITQPNIKK
jgi:hypothetical protein